MIIVSQKGPRPFSALAGSGISRQTHALLKSVCARHLVSKDFYAFLPTSIIFECVSLQKVEGRCPSDYCHECITPFVIDRLLSDSTSWTLTPTWRLANSQP